MKYLKPQNSLFIITGGPGVGKTTLLEEIKRNEMIVIPEIARALIKEQQDIDGDALPWKNKNNYFQKMFNRSIQNFEMVCSDLRNDVPVFFDRSFLDALCYAALEGLAISSEMKSYAEHWRYNNQVFLLPPWKEIYGTDTQRHQEWNEAVFTYNKMIQTYRGYGYELLEVPKATPVERADFVLEHIPYLMK
ncbi:MAG: ATPase [Pseudozobellia sp.]|nr:ATPase [Pseudozobellia sp.]MBG48056.1 ATPase [Pseudozobellia sp.]